MPILFVVKPSRRRLYEALRRAVARPGLVGVVLERRHRERRVARVPFAFVNRRGFTLRQPLDGDSARTWDELGFLVVKVRELTESAAPSPRALRPRARRPGPAGRAAPRKRPR